jgi:hypothetical protein
MRLWSLAEVAWCSFMAFVFGLHLQQPVLGEHTTQSGEGAPPVRQIWASWLFTDKDLYYQKSRTARRNNAP